MTTKATTDVLADGSVTTAKIADASVTTAKIADANVTAAKIVNGEFPFPAMWIQGLVPSNNAGDATNDLDFTAGQCRDATNARNIVVAALTKRSDATFVVGTNQGMLDTGAIGNAEYYVFAILRSDTGVTDILCSLSSTAPTMPANYDHKRLVGYFLRAGGTIVAFNATELEGGGLKIAFNTPPALDKSSTGTTANRTLTTVAVPTGLRVLWKGHLTITGGAGGTQRVFLSDPNCADVATGLTTSPLASLAWNGAAGTTVGAQQECFTNTSAQIGVRVSQSTDSIYIQTLGFNWARRN